MKKINKKDYIFFFLVIILFFLIQLVFKCQSFKNFSFDSQVLALWKYAASKGLMPYRDLFYPYGIFSYYKQISPFLIFINYILQTLLFMAIYYMLSAVYARKVYAYFVFLIFLFFVSLHTGSDFFLRYGLVIGFSVLSILFFSKEKKSLLPQFIFGVVAGIIFSLFPDQGIISILIYTIYAAFFVLRKFAVNKQHTNILVNGILGYCSFLGGVLTILIIYFSFLFHLGILNKFFYAFIEFGYISVFAKIPFPPSLLTPDNMFTILILIISIAYVSFQYFVIKKKFSEREFILIGLILPLAFLEQKNVLRSIDWQLTFVGVLIYLVLLASFFNGKKSNIEKNILLLISVIFILFFSGFKVTQGTVNILSLGKSCQDNGEMVKPIFNNYLQVFNELSKGGVHKIYSFPSDPIFYVLFKQQPPYYPTIYEASFQQGQEKRIAYLNSSNISYVIVNTKIHSIQDNVPDYVRAKYELKYILRNFGYYKSIGDFLILRKGDSQDIFTGKGSKVLAFDKYLLDIDLKYIPYTEAAAKKSFLDKTVIRTDSLMKFNENLNLIKISSNNKILTLRTKSNEKVTLTISDSEGLESKIRMINCAKLCLLNLESVPLFYRDRIIKFINSDQEILELNLYQNSSSAFW